ncbi:hypothetical protein JHK82_012190 [Glycine max]|uniref:Uncharacterized protein n=2 Tax=Glycine subgen. Soja TaxID=1462606 RepID=K7KNY1_SOYBN|nr:hypothetical protein JHK85_012527 [Glycine max]RZC11515.1 hypothetical protein D0Y65_011630 [Glycine soja]KAG5057197.1 hypothetical protein JHK86_012193 [Glycine max]KAG5154221.1 hypothetical protein JHK82_012190 [Glycine max]KAH1133338.1 hypothetical protein GYH30_011960 [Glycine max]
MVCFGGSNSPNSLAFHCYCTLLPLHLLHSVSVTKDDGALLRVPLMLALLKVPLRPENIYHLMNWVMKQRVVTLVVYACFLVGLCDIYWMLYFIYSNIIILSC